MLNLEFVSVDPRKIFRARILDYEIDIYLSGYEKDNEWTYAIWWIGSQVAVERKSSWSLFDVKLNVPELAVERHMAYINEKRAKKGLRTSLPPERKGQMSETATLEPQTELVKVEPVAGTELATIDLTNAVALFSTNGCDPIIDTVRRQAEAIKPLLDISSDKGRKQVASAAARIATVKNDVEKAGKDYAAKVKALPKMIDAERGRVWDALEAIQKDLRKPLTDWETEKEAERVVHEQALRDMQFAAAILPACSSEEIQKAIAAVDAAYAREWKEFTGRATKEYEAHCARLNQWVIEAVERERLAAITHQQRVADDLRRKKEREEAIKAQATKDAEAKAKKIADDLAAKVLADKLAAEAETKRLEKEKADAVQRAKDLEVLREKVRVDGHQLILEAIAEIKGTGIRILSTQECNARIERLETFKDRNWEEFVERGENAYKGALNYLKECRNVAGERERQEAEDARLESERLAEARVQAAVEREKARVAHDAEVERLKTESREKNEKNRKKINKKVQAAIAAILREIPADAVATSDDIAEAVQKAIEEGKIPNTRITY